MRKVVVITYSYWNFDAAKIKIGGLETYLDDLLSLIVRVGGECIVYQSTDCVGYQEVVRDSVKIVPKYFKKINRRSYQKMFDHAYRLHNDRDTIFIVATDQMDVRSDSLNVVAIQHGISWDIPHSMIKGFWGCNILLRRLNKYLRCYVNSRRYANVKNLVCVDYNYFNWLRTLEDIAPGHDVRVIPNYTSDLITEEDLEAKLQKSTSVRRILFARRFVDYRGTLMFSAVAERLLEEFPSLEITFAGNGPLHDHILKRFETSSRVTVTSFEAKESVTFHYNYDMAVVPTIFSEGTSLSLCEAMSAGCIPVATHVGGMTNIIIDGFNGFLSPIGEEQLYQTIRKAILMTSSERETIVRNAFATVRSGFSRQKWEQSWMQLLNVL